MAKHSRFNQIFQKIRPAYSSYVYLRHIFLTMLVIYPVAMNQGYRYLGEMPPIQFFIGPTLAAIIIGTLLGRSVQLKRELQTKSKQFRAIADLAQEFIYLRSIDGQYEYVSPSCKEFTGYDQQKFYNTPNLMDQLIHPDDIELWKKGTTGSGLSLCIIPPA